MQLEKRLEYYAEAYIWQQIIRKRVYECASFRSDSSIYGFASLPELTNAMSSRVLSQGTTNFVLSASSGASGGDVPAAPDSLDADEDDLTELEPMLTPPRLGSPVPLDRTSA